MGSTVISGFISLLVRLPNGLVKSLRHLVLPLSVCELKEKLELVVGFPASRYHLSYPGVNGEILPDDFMLSSEETTENALICVSLSEQANKLYHTAVSSSTHGSTSQSIWSLINQSELDSPSAINQSEESFLFTALFISSHVGHTDLCRQLISAEPDIVHMKTAGGNLALHAACVCDRVEVAVLLACSGSRTNERNGAGKTCLEVALESGALTCYRKLKQVKLRLHRKAAEDRLQAGESREDNSKLNAEKSGVANGTDVELQQTSEYRQLLASHRDIITVSSRPPSMKSRSNITLESRRPKTAPVTKPPKSARQSAKTKVKSDENAYTSPVIRALSARPRVQYNYRRFNTGADERNVRLCRQPEVVRGRCKSAGETPDWCKKNSFKLTRPQYLQYIKSSTGIIEEDYFADIFPDVEKDVASDSENETRASKELTKRKRRILKKMMIDSSLIRESDASDTDEEEKLVTEVLNQRAYRKWTHKKQEQKKSEGAKLAMTAQPPSDSRLQQQCLTPLLLVGDTWSGETAQDHKVTADKYMSAYKDYQRARSAPVRVTFSDQQNIDPLPYNSWVESKYERINTLQDYTASGTKQKPQPNLTKRIEYKDWLEVTNLKIKREKDRQRKEKKYEVDFEKWIKELKEEVDTFNYWRRNKEQELARQRSQQRKREEREESKKNVERGKRVEMSSQVYHSWVSEKDKILLQREKSKLNKQRLQNQ